MNPDCLPTLHLWHKKKAEPKRESTERWEKRKERRQSIKRLEASQSLLSLGESSCPDHESTEAAGEESNTNKKIATATQTNLNILSMKKNGRRAGEK